MSKAIRWTPEALAEYRKRTIIAPAAPSAPTVKPAKYKNKKTELDGIKFDSKIEAERWAKLKLLEAAGYIKDLKRQVPFELIPKQVRSDGKAERACNYLADFVYVDGGIRVVEDCKGFKTKDYVIKRKLMLYIHKITVVEV